MDPEINDVYFRKFLIPLLLTIVALLGAAAMIATPPGTPLKWDTFSSALGSSVEQTTRSVGGALLRRR